MGAVPNILESLVLITPQGYADKLVEMIRAHRDGYEAGMAVGVL